MRIKLFEEYNDGIEEISIEEYHKLLLGNDMDTYVLNNWVDFTKDEIKELEKYIQCSLKNFYSKYKVIYQGSLRKSPNFIKSVFPGLDREADIIKLRDEWYIVSFSTHNTFYKCDQFYSLIKLIKRLNEN